METEEERLQRFEAFQLRHEHAEDAEDRERKTAQAAQDLARRIDRRPARKRDGKCITRTEKTQNQCAQPRLPDPPVDPSSDVK